MNTSAARAVLRVARRSVGRNRWRSVLIGLLIMLPVAGMVGGVTWLRTITPTVETEATWRMGGADLLVYSISPESRSTEQLRAILPRGAVVEPIAFGDATLVLPGRRVAVGVRSTNLEGLGRGTLELIEGRLPGALDEVAVSPSVASVAQVELDDRVQIETIGDASVVGLIDDPSRLSAPVVLLHPAFADRGLAQANRAWLVALGEDEAPVDLGPSFASEPRIPFWVTGHPELAILVFGALGLAGTVLVGAAAFAVSIRRRQRELGMLAAAGASRRQLAGTVLAEGLVLAGLAVAAGLVAGIGLLMLASPWMDALTGHRNPPLVLDLVAIGLACAIGLLAGVAAAAAPAWTAARLPAVAALSGRRPPTTSARRTLMIGLALVGLSVALTGTGAALLLVDRTNGGAPLLLAGAAILGVLGFGASSPWLVERLEWIGRRLPLAGRIALRDTARARSRTSPIITATLASLAVAIAISAMAASASVSFYRGWLPWGRADQLLLNGHYAARVGPEVAEQMSAVASGIVPAPGVDSSDGADRDLSVFVTNGGDAPAIDPQLGCADCRFGFNLTVGTPNTLAALGVPAEAAVMPPDSVVLLTVSPFEARRAILAVREVVGQEPTPDGGLIDIKHFTHTETITARAFDVGAAAGISTPYGTTYRFPTAFIAPETAARLGFRAADGNNGFLIRLDRPVTEADVAFAATLLGNSPNTGVEASLPPTDPNGLAGVIATLLSVLLALTITAIAVALGESEARADQRTLLAVGADPRLRRRIVAARAGVIALLAALLAVPAGLLPAWALYAGNDQPFVVPLPEIIAVIAVLPLAAIAGALLLSRPIPSWSAFRDVSAS
ncbi:hypothetical protein BH23CHL7_BH23CHL7_04260 [soil metagenome]